MQFRQFARGATSWAAGALGYTAGDDIVSARQGYLAARDIVSARQGYLAAGDIVSPRQVTRPATTSCRRGNGFGDYSERPITTAVIGRLERMVPYRVRIRFSKQGDLRLISHRDLVRTIERLFRRAGVLPRMSEGFHPKPRMSFPSALGLGIAGLDEVMEVDLQEELPPAQLIAALAAQAPVGLTFHAAEIVAPGVKKAQIRSLSYEVPVPPRHRADLPAAASRLLAAESWPVSRPGRESPIDVRPLILDLQIGGDRLRMQLQATHEAGVRPRDVLAALGWEDDLETAVWALERTVVELQS